MMKGLGLGNMTLEYPYCEIISQYNYHDILIFFNNYKLDAVNLYSYFVLSLIIKGLFNLNYLTLNKTF